MKRKRIVLIVSILAVLSLAGWLFWPLASSRWKIPVDEEKLAGKAEYLTALPRMADTSYPNIVIILADDLAKIDLSCYGSDVIQTPHLDKLASQGIQYDKGYVTSSVCSPSRAGLLTGRYQQRFGFEMVIQNRYPRNRLEYYVFKYLIDTDNWHVTDRMSFPSRSQIARQGLPESEITLAEILQTVGYRTAIIGKWHLGTAPELIPNNRGFDYQYGFYEAFSLYADSSREDMANAYTGEFSDKHIWSKGRRGASAIRRNDTVIVEEEYLTAKLAKEASVFIEKNRQEPFFLYLPFSAPHTPFQVPEKYTETFGYETDPVRRVYLGMIQALDDAVGEVMATLDSLGLAENTLVFFASDNGGALYTLASTNFPLAGGKISSFEGGVNIPFLFRWTGHVGAGKQARYPVTLMDIFATVLSVAGISPPDDRVYDGRSLVALDETSEKSISDLSEYPVFWRQDYSKAMRKGKWKLIWDEKHKVVLLFDLEADPSEKFDLSIQFPEKAEELKGLILEWEKGLQKPLWPGVMDHEFNIYGKKYYFPV